MDAKIRGAKADHVEGGLRGLVMAAEDLLGEAARRAPLDEGTLRASGAITLIVNRQRFDGPGMMAAAIAAARAATLGGLPVTIEAEVSFNTVYAARQHEETTWRHPRAGEAKYLERPLLERGDRYREVIRLSAAKGGSI